MKYAIIGAGGTGGSLGFFLACSSSLLFIFILLCCHIYILNDLYWVLLPFLNGKLRTFYAKVTEFLKINK